MKEFFKRSICLRAGVINFGSLEVKVTVDTG